MKHKKIRIERNGFTLLELMIVVAIIGIIGSITMPRFDMALVRAYQSAAKGNLGTIRTTVGLYYADVEGQYPMQGYADGYADSYGMSLSQVLAPKYIPKLPTPVLRDRLAGVAGFPALVYDPTARAYMENSTPVKDVVMFTDNHQVQNGWFRPFGYDQKNGLVFMWNDNYDMNGVPFDSW